MGARAIEAPDTKDAAADMAEEVLMMEAERVRRDAENGGATVSRQVREVHDRIDADGKS